MRCMLWLWWYIRYIRTESASNVCCFTIICSYILGQSTFHSKCCFFSLNFDSLGSNFIHSLSLTCRDLVDDVQPKLYFNNYMESWFHSWIVARREETEIQLIIKKNTVFTTNEVKQEGNVIKTVMHSLTIACTKMHLKDDAFCTTQQVTTNILTKLNKMIWISKAILNLNVLWKVICHTLYHRTAINIFWFLVLVLTCINGTILFAYTSCTTVWRGFLYE